MLKLRRDRLSLVLAAVLVAHAVWASDCWPVVARAWWFATDAASYRQHRRHAAFHEFPIDDLRQALDAYLPGRRHVALSDAIVHDEFMRQRLTEGLYPRVIDARAPFTLEFVPGNRFDPETGVRLAAIDGGRFVVLYTGQAT